MTQPLSVSPVTPPLGAPLARWRRRITASAASAPEMTAFVAASMALALLVGLGLLLRLGGSSAGASYSWFLTMEASYDSWGPMIAAYAHAKEQSGNLYDVFFVDHVKYQYPPAALGVIWGLDALRITGVANQVKVLNQVTWLFVLLTVPFAFGIAWKESRPNPRLGQTAERWRLAACLVVGLATLAYWPVMMAWKMGQIQAVLNALFVMALCLWIAERRFLAGIAIGLICIIKPQFLLFMVWGLLVDRRFLYGQMLVAAVSLGLSLLVFGFAAHLGYLSMLSFISAHGESYVLNQSVNGFLNRLVFPETAWVDRGRIWPDGSDFPDYDVRVYAGSLLTSLAALGTAFWFTWRRGATTMTFCFSALAMTMASPVAWDHHYGILIGIFAAAFGALIRLGLADPRGKVLGLALLVCFIGTGVRWIPRMAGHPIVENLLLSHLLIAALGTLVLLWRVQVFADATASSVRDAPARRMGDLQAA